MPDWGVTLARTSVGFDVSHYGTCAELVLQAHISTHVDPDDPLLVSIARTRKLTTIQFAA